ncbi:unnamed protein product [Macrosiphum euphorbiae]|uniref:Uncharacterized protein n=1 Tax=Macrosiphum euphorbiae TaxID=13131 RepID=A0AAV0VN15_9HEMI|nr:unnamed protein product [Macrosiphum euphorbiae]
MTSRDIYGNTFEVEINDESTGNAVSSELCDEFVGQESALEGSTDSLVETTDFGHGLQSAGDAADFGRVYRSEFETQELQVTIADSPRRLADSGQRSVGIVLEKCAGSQFRMYISILNRAITTPLDAPQVRTDTPSAAPPQLVVSPMPLVRGLEGQLLSTRRPCSFRLSTEVSLDVANALHTDLWARIEDALVAKRVPPCILVRALRSYFDGSLPNSSEPDGRAVTSGPVLGPTLREVVCDDLLQTGIPLDVREISSTTSIDFADERGLPESVDSEQTALGQQPLPEVRRRDESPEPVVQERPRRKSIWKRTKRLIRRMFCCGA